MSRIRNAWRALMEAEPEVPATEYGADGAVNETEGPLFGLTPPDGCHFDVSYDHSHPPAWFVKIVRGGQSFATECAISRGESDEEMIVRAAGKAIAAYERKQKVKVLEGCYPPKRAKGAK
jgi:hypothetical protein